MKHQTQILLDVDITYEVLDAIQIENQVFPPMIELTAAFVSLKKQNGKVSRINILKVLNESQKMLIEDAVFEELVRQ